MPRFENLSDHDFELLAADLLGAELGTRFETFPRGRDGGIDLRGRTSDNGLHLVQCKHYERSSFSNLKRAAIDERAKLGAMDDVPDRYTFVTSHPLTANNKRQLIDALRPYVRDERDVLGADDLEGLLRKHPAILRANVKLWLGSLEPLRHVLSADVHARSQALVEDIRATLPRYVQTRSVHEALRLLGAHRTLIVAGPSGVGKTTLARLLLLRSFEEGFVPYSVQTDIGEAWKLLKEVERPVFFIDDFLGRTSLFDTGSVDTRDLTAFIKSVRHPECQARLILTTREYILGRGRTEDEHLRWTALGSDEYSLTLGSYTRIERARIFYNHIYFSPQVNKAARRDLLTIREGRPGYLWVIDHDDYSPRLIEWMTGLSGYSLDPADRRDYTAFCLNVLDHPGDLWAYAYERGLTEAARRLLLLLSALPTEVEVDELEESFRALGRQVGVPSGQRQFEDALKVVQDSFVKIERRASKTYISVLNPSLIDFLRARLIEDPTALIDHIAAATTFERVEALYGIWKAGGHVLPDRVLDAVVSATAATFGAPQRDHADYHGHQAQTLSDWIEEHPAIADRLTGTFAIAERLLARQTLDIAGPEILDLANLAVRWRELGLPHENLMDAIKTQGHEVSEQWEFAAALGLLEAAVPERFSPTERAYARKRLTDFAELALTESAQLFDDDWDFDRFMALLDELRIAVDSTRAAAARHDLVVDLDRRVYEHAMSYAAEDDLGLDELEDPRADEDDEIDRIFRALEG